MRTAHLAIGVKPPAAIGNDGHPQSEPKKKPGAGKAPGHLEVNEMRSENTSARKGTQVSNHHDTRQTPQNVGASGVAFFETRLGAIAAIDLLTAAEEDLTEGLPVSARQSITDAISGMEDAGRADFAIGLELLALPPLWQIDAELHQRRAKALSHYLPNGSMGDDGIFRDADEDADRAFLVHPNDVWIASTGTAGWRIVGTGLTSLIAYLKGQGVDVVALEMAKRLKIGDVP